MVKEVTTKSGFAVSVDMNRADDMELIEALAQLQQNELMIPKVAAMLIGEEGKRRLYDHLRTPAGNVPIQAFTEELFEIMEATIGKN